MVKQQAMMEENARFTQLNNTLFLHVNNEP